MPISKGEKISKKKEHKNVRLEELFNKINNLTPNVVILEGESGYGKSFTTQKIMHDWADGKLYSDRFDLVILLKCDEMRFYPEISSEPKSLLDLVSHQRFCDVIKEKMEMSPHKILFLIDGFDEFVFSEEDIKSSLDNKASTKSILCRLMSGLILPESFLLVTTRPPANRLISRLKDYPKRFAQILGFTEKGMEEYFKNFGKNGNEMFQTMKGNKMLFNNCLNPFLCWITCKAQGKKNVANLTEWGTNTSIYLEFVTSLLSQRCKTQILSELGIRAKEVMKDDKIHFSLPSECNDTEIEVIFKCIKVNKSYSFIHQSFVEFFTVLSYVLDAKESQRDVEKLLISVQSDSQSNPHLQPVLKFLFGLSNEKVRGSLQELLTQCLPDSICLITQLKQWILAGKKEQTDIFLLHCLYELHDKEFINEVMLYWDKIELTYNMLTHTDCWVLKYCLQHSFIRRLDLRHCNLTVDKLELLEDVWKTLKCDELM